MYFFVVKNIAYNFLHTDESHELFSDHIAIVLTLSEKIISRENNPASVQQNTDWISCRITFETNIQPKFPLKNPNQLDYEVKMFIEIGQNAAWYNTRQIKRK